MLQFCALASGSEGNAFFMRTDKTRILIDAGLTCARIIQALSLIGERAGDLDAVLISHAHGDHTQGLRSLTKRFHMPVYATQGTVDVIDGDLVSAAPEYHAIHPGDIFRVGDIEATSFPVPHDCASPVGFSFVGDGVHVGFATDLGSIDDTDAASIFPWCDLVYMESNHDVSGLAHSAYEPFHKQRVREQHLSNDLACAFIADRLTAKTSTLILGHLSKNCNDPRLVRLMAKRALNGRGAKTNLVVAEPGQPTEVFKY